MLMIMTVMVVVPMMLIICHQHHHRSDLAEDEDRDKADHHNIDAVQSISVIQWWCSSLSWR